MIVYNIGCAALITRGIFGVNYVASLNSMNFIMLLMLASDLACNLIDIHRTTKDIELLQGRVLMRTAYRFRKTTWHLGVPAITISVSLLGNVFYFMPYKAIAIYSAVYILTFYAQLILVLSPLMIWYEMNLQNKF